MPDTAPETTEQRRERIQRSLQMPDMAEAKAQAEADVVGQKPAPSIADDPKMRDTYAFDIKWTDGREKVWSGRFVNKILSIRERKMFANLLTRQTGNAPLGSIPENAFTLVYTTCWMDISLQARPEWFRDMDSLLDEGLIEAVFEEVAAHERCFHGHKPPGAPSSS